jgi:hypothetical protein
MHALNPAATRMARDRPPQRGGLLMLPLSAPYRVRYQFRGPPLPPRLDRLPVPWAVRIANTRAARVAVDCLRCRDVCRVEILTGPGRIVYVRWTE